MRALIVEDNVSCCEVFRSMVAALDWEVHTAHNGRKAVELLKSIKFNAIILDINVPEVDGFEMMQLIRDLSPNTRTIVVSGSIGVTETVKALKLGAFDCLPKPFKHKDLIDILKRVSPEATSVGPSGLLAVSEQMCEVQAKINTVAKASSIVLVTGETGTGKEVVAQQLHQASDRKDRPFVAVNCSAIPPTLIESELFGHEKGAFTDARNARKGFFEQADDGTIFLDEIGDLSMDLQSKLLRVLQERVYRRVGGSQEIPLHARVVAATNVDLAAAVRKGTFREDLYYRLAVIPIHLVPLRERQADIIPLAERFLSYFARELKCDMPMLTDQHKDMLFKHMWPGNVRELRNVMERFVVMSGRLEFVSATRDLKVGPPVEAMPVKEAEREMILSMIERLIDKGTDRKALNSA